MVNGAVGDQAGEPGSIPSGGGAAGNADPNGSHGGGAGAVRPPDGDTAPGASAGDATLILARLSAGDQSAAEELMPLVYEQLRHLASGYFRGQRKEHTLQATALVHEAFLRLIHADSAAYQGRSHFMAVAATAMRQILTDHARRVKAAKRGGDRRRVGLEGDAIPGAAQDVDLVALNEALDELRELDPRKHRIVELRFFGGLTVEEVADLLDVSKRTVEGEWRAARAWLGTRVGS